MPIVNTDEFIASKIDYLVVGGGTSGLVVAARLAEDPNTVVGVIEAGAYHENAPLVNVPGMMARAIHNPDFDWAWSTVPQKYANDRKVLQSRGKGLGGSSALNFLAMVRPAKDELDAFEQLGNPGWNWDTTLHYMKKCETLQAPDLSPEQAKEFAAIPIPGVHGTSGPIAKSFPPHITELHSAMLDSLSTLGVPRNPDNSDGNPVGAILFPTTVDAKTAKRSYSASAYYAPNAQKPNFVVLTGAQATRLVLTAGNGGLQRATGVEFVKDGKIFTVNASKEVILSAGTFQSPQLLELSGIGDNRVLSSVGIDTVIDLPGVGENMQDHALTPTIVQVDNKIESLEILYNPDELKKQEKLYEQQKGILAGIPSSCSAFIPGNIFGSDEDVQRWVTLSSTEGSPEEIFKNTHPDVLKGIKKQYGIMKKWIDDPRQPFAQLLNLNGHFPVPGLAVDHDKRYATLLIAYCHPFSRGTVHITSSAPLEPPAIQQNYLSNPADLEILARMLKFMKNLYATEPLKTLVKGSVVPTFNEDEEGLKEYVRNTLLTVHHPVGTCSMLPKEDGGVVDSNLLVYGTENLRVIDCSIIPLQISSNIQVLAYAIGEKGADIIKAAH